MSRGRLSMFSSTVALGHQVVTLCPVTKGFPIMEAASASEMPEGLGNPKHSPEMSFFITAFRFTFSSLRPLLNPT